MHHGRRLFSKNPYTQAQLAKSKEEKQNEGALAKLRKGGRDSNETHDVQLQKGGCQEHGSTKAHRNAASRKRQERKDKKRERRESKLTLGRRKDERE